MSRIPLRASAILIAVTCALLASGTSMAAMIDFVAEAAGDERAGIPDFQFANVDGSGISLTITARDLSDAAGVTEPTDPYPYLDDLFEGRRGGLGVCQTGECGGTSDDNLGWAQMGEVLILEFDAPVTIQSISFNNGDHFQVFSGNIGIHVGAGNPITAASFNNTYVAAALLAPNLTGTRFSFVAPESFNMAPGGVDEQLYIDTITFIPEPGTGLLLGLGLGALAIRRRR